MTAQVLSTVVLIFAVVFSSMRYRALNSRYPKERAELASDASFLPVYVTLVPLGTVVAVCSYWMDWQFLLKIHDCAALQLFGSFVSLAGLFGFEASIRALGANYSPCYDLRVPPERVKAGPYRWIAHPIYVSNVTILIGVFISSGSLWLALVALIVGIYYWRSARVESRALARMG
ncbi:methyltransferase family protein [Rubrivivax albus]|uniref:Isoprenylcysteine carboxylmethyltransferase family protein n=1 Tax=Rubrivivax albus TaxID=2499835 RepID=A0A3S2ULA0_9BURK|nr:methyltransferase [Rubrivivax albus]RVT48111.1 hypothetical protein ENE75_23270 [Rubrivivax albus]